MPGDINALQAVVKAGGFKVSGGQGHVVVMSRFDIVIAPRSGISRVGIFVQQYRRNTLPLSFS